MGNKYKPSSTGDGGSRPEAGTRKPSESVGGKGEQPTTDRRQDYAVFIPHSWEYGQEYARLVRLLKNADRFESRNYSVPKDEKFEGKTDEELEEIIREKQIKPASVVVVPAGVYSTHSDWIKKEVKIAKEEDKPILGVKPWGNKRTSSFVKKHADKVVGWNTDSVADGIRDLAP